MARRLTRKEILRKDFIQALLTRGYRWIVRNRKQLTVALLLVLVLLAGLFVWQWSLQGKSEAAEQLFAEALGIHHGTVGTAQPQNSPQEQQAPVPRSRHRFSTAQERAQQALEEFQAIADQYPASQSGQLALYYVALNQQRLGETQKAREILVDLIGRVQTTEIRNLMRHCLAQLAEIDKNHDEAIRILQDILKEAVPPFPLDTVLMRLAQNYEAVGNPDEALKFYKQITAEYPSSPHSESARNRADELEELEELAEETS